MSDEGQEAGVEAQDTPGGGLPWDRRTNESGAAFGVFRLYIEAGPDRSLADVARRSGRGLSQVKDWSARHAWVDRAAAYDAHMARVADEARERAAAEDAEVWERRRRAECLDLFTLGLELRARAREMLAHPLTETFKESDGVTIVKPTNWTQATAATMAKMSADLIALGIGEALADDGFDPLEATPEECAEWLRRQAERRREVRAALGGTSKA
jgi:hypothetical protein